VVSGNAPMEIGPVAVAIISGVFGLIAGAVGSLIAPWVHWGIEKRRNKLDRRRALIDNTRIFLSGDAPTREDYRQSPAYAAIRPYLSQRIRDNIQQRNTSGAEQILREDILQEIAALEKRWKLI